LKQQRIGLLLLKIDKRIEVQRKIIEDLEKLSKAFADFIMSSINKGLRLDAAESNGMLKLYRGRVIPKHCKDLEYKYPVYSSSITNEGINGIFQFLYVLRRTYKLVN
jgi:hypothetical protein